MATWLPSAAYVNVLVLTSTWNVLMYKTTKRRKFIGEVAPRSIKKTGEGLDGLEDGGV